MTGHGTSGPCGRTSFGGGAPRIGTRRGQGLRFPPMSRRIEIELTSAKPDGSWTWRAAGAREPKGVVDGSLLPADVSVGVVLRADAEFDLDGITVLSVLAPKGPRKAPERIELIAERAFEPVTSQLATRERRDRSGDDRKGRGDREGRGDRPRGDRPRGDGPRGDRPRGERPGGDRPGAARREGGDRPRRDPRSERTDAGREARSARPPRAPRPEPTPRPKPKRLRPGRQHRERILSELPAEHRPVAEHVLRGGIPAVRQAVDEQNAALRAESKPEIKSGPLVALAEELLPSLRAAEWRDRAEAALADVEELDLRDLRSVVAASDSARDEESRELATKLQEALGRRQDKEHADWLAEIEGALGDGRSVRALRLSSRPPKAGVPFPADLAGRLGAAASATLTSEATTDRWIAVLDALALSPVRHAVRPVGLPASPADELRAAITRLASQLPEIATLFGVTAPAGPVRRPPAPNRRPPRPPKPDAVAPKPVVPQAESDAQEPAPPDGGSSEAAETMTPSASESVPMDPDAASSTDESA